MIKARIRWCTCRVENILTLGKLLSVWFSNLLSYIISSYELARPIMGTIFLVIIIIIIISMNKSQELTVFPKRQKLTSAKY